MLSYILAILASYRLARMIAVEDGAFDVFVWIREHIDPEQRTWLGRGLNCRHCVGFWTSLVWALLLAHQDLTMQRSETLLAWIAISGGATFLFLIEDSLTGIAERE